MGVPAGHRGGRELVSAPARGERCARRDRRGRRWQRGLGASGAAVLARGGGGAGLRPPGARGPGADARSMGRFTLFALSAATDALRSAGLLPGGSSSSSNAAEEGRDREGPFGLAGYDSDRVGVAIGSGIGSLSDITAAWATLEGRGPAKLSPYFVPKILVNMPAGQVALRHGLRGPQLAPSKACATGAHSIGDAFRCIALAGDADSMQAGATEASVDRLSMAGFARMRALDDWQVAGGGVAALTARATAS